MLKLSVFFCLVLLLSGCSGGPADISVRETVPVQVAASIQVQSDLDGVNTALITFTQGRHVFSADLPVQGMSVAGGLQVPIGTWDVKLVLFDSVGEPRFQDELKSIAVAPGSPIDLQFNLRPADALVHINIDLEGFPGADNILRARVYFDDDLKEIVDETSGENFGNSYSIPPGSYDFSIQLYTDSFRISDRVFQGIWQVLDVMEGEEITIAWRPEAQTVTIDAAVHHLPDSPAAPSAVLNADGVLVHWNVAMETGLFHVFWQPNPWERFIRLTEAPIAGDSFYHQEGSGTGLYSLATVSNTGILGYRSAPISVH